MTALSILEFVRVTEDRYRKMSAMARLQRSATAPAPA